jgi:hypothetical protein
MTSGLEEWLTRLEENGISRYDFFDVDKRKIKRRFDAIVTEEVRVLHGLKQDVFVVTLDDESERDELIRFMDSNYYLHKDDGDDDIFYRPQEILGE